MLISLRNRAASLGGDTVVVVSTNTDPYHMSTGVPGLGMLSPGCSNCVTMVARVYECGGGAQPDGMGKALWILREPRRIADASPSGHAVS